MSENSVNLPEGTFLRVKQLEKTLTQHENHPRKLKDRVEIIGEGDDRRLDLLEERVEVLDAQNIELRSRLNLVVDTVNNIKRAWNEQVDEGQPQGEVKEIDDDDRQAPKDKEPPQLTLQQVYAMYRNKPMDEEGWEEMFKAIEAAERYEASLPTGTRGLTQDEWNDLLQI